MPRLISHSLHIFILIIEECRTLSQFLQLKLHFQVRIHTFPSSSSFPVLTVIIRIRDDEGRTSLQYSQYKKEYYALSDVGKFECIRNHRLGWSRGYDTGIGGSAHRFTLMLYCFIAGLVTVSFVSAVFPCGWQLFPMRSLTKKRSLLRSQASSFISTHSLYLLPNHFPVSSVLSHKREYGGNQSSFKASTERRQLDKL